MERGENMTEMEKLYQERIARFATTASLQEPDKVPILGFYETWALGYTKTRYEEMLRDFDVEMNVYQKTLADFPFDGVISTGKHRASNLYRALGRDSYQVSEDGYTLQHEEVAMMPDPDEYDKLIADPLGFTMNELIVRKYPNLQGSNQQQKNILKAAMGAGMAFVSQMQEGEKQAREKYGMPNIYGNWAVSPVDILFDYYRGFKGISLDVRRRPDKIIEAADKLADLLLPFIASNQHCKGGYPFYFIPIHLPGFLSPKQFEKVYWPSFKKLYVPLMEQGFRFNFYFETAADHLFDYLLELPKGQAIITLEKDDVVEAKKKIGHHVTIAGGLRADKLKFGKTQDSLDEVKRVMDACAPGGGFILTTDKILIAPDDVQPAAFREVLEFASEYGKY